MSAGGSKIDQEGLWKKERFGQWYLQKKKRVRHCFCGNRWDFSIVSAGMGRTRLEYLQEQADCSRVLTRLGRIGQGILQ